MAKVYSAIVGFCVIFLINLNHCNSFINENSNYEKYEITSNQDNFEHVDFVPIHSVRKRQIGGTSGSIGGSTTDLKPIQPTNPLAANTSAPAQVIPDVKQEPPGILDTGGVTNIAATVATNALNVSLATSVLQDKRLLGVNGTGQRKYFPKKTDIVSEPIDPVVPPSKVPKLSAPKKVNIMDLPQFMPDDDLIDEIDQPENNTRKELTKHNITKVDEDYHLYYNSSVIVDKDLIGKYWEEFKNISSNTMLSRSHRRAMTVHLTFDFPFYGHKVRNVTVATGGFLYTGEYVHSWLAATQYIAPLMANFDTSLADDSYVKFRDNGTSFTVLWEKVALQDKPEVGTFTFATTLHSTGDIVFTYFSVPIAIEAIQDDKHPVRVGLSDAYIIDKYVFFSRRKTIYEYHSVNFQSPHIQNSTIISLTPQKTCLEFTDCVSCISVSINFDCTWCPTLNKCSTGTDRKRQDWIAKGCDKTQITDTRSCPALGDKGNNAAQQPPDSNETKSDPTWGDTNPSYDNSKSMQHINEIGRSMNSNQMGSEQKDKNGSSVGIVLGFMLPICLIMSMFLWVLYAYRNPHTKSGQLLIQYRPSQWTWRRGEARYTAATIHM